MRPTAIFIPFYSVVPGAGGVGDGPQLMIPTDYDSVFYFWSNTHPQWGRGATFKRGGARVLSGDGTLRRGFAEYIMNKVYVTETIKIKKIGVLIFWGDVVEGGRRGDY